MSIVNMDTRDLASYMHMGSMPRVPLPLPRTSSIWAALVNCPVRLLIDMVGRSYYV